MSRLTIRIRKKPKKKSTWMKGFSPAKRADDLSSIMYESAMARKDYWHRMIKYGAAK